jgi:hypothetical protein
VSFNHTTWGNGQNELQERSTSDIKIFIYTCFGPPGSGSSDYDHLDRCGSLAGMADGNGISGLAVPHQIITGDFVSRLRIKFRDCPFDSGTVANRIIRSCFCACFSNWISHTDGRDCVARAFSQGLCPLDCLVGEMHGDYTSFIDKHYSLLGAAITKIKKLSLPLKQAVVYAV